MDCLVTASEKATVKLVSLSVENFVLADCEGSTEVPAATLAVLSDLTPDLVRFILSAEADVVITLEFFAVLGDDTRSEDCSGKTLKHLFLSSLIFLLY